MLEILVVDDIPSQVESFATTISAEELGIAKIHKAFSGKEAIQLYEKNTIHMILTDIRMPEMSGVELIKEIRKRNKKIKIIVISGYADFEYAKSVVPYNISGYLMKPVNSAQLRETLQDVLEEIKLEKKREQEQHRDVYALRENLPSLKGELLNRLLVGRAISNAELERKLFLLNVPFEMNESIGLFVVSIEGKLQEYKASDKRLIEYAITNMAEELLQDMFHSWYCRDQNEYLVFIVAAKEKTSSSNLLRCELDVRAAALKKKVDSLLDGNVSIILAEQWTEFPKHISPLYRLVIDGIRRMEESKKGLFHRIAGSLEQVPVQIASLESLYRPPLFIHLLDTGNWNQAEEKLKQIFVELKNGYFPPEHANEAYFAIANAYQYIAHKKGKLLSEMGAGTFGLMPTALCVKKLEAWAFNLLRIFKEQAGDYSEKQASLVDKVHKYIEENMNDSLSLQSIAAHIGLHPAYLSRVYRAETGNNLSEYIQRYKMELASHLLRHSDKKIYEIAQMIGYIAVPHFIKKFKAYSTMTPQEYRDRVENK